MQNVLILYDGIFISLDQMDNVYHKSAIVVEGNRIKEIGEMNTILKKYKECKQKINCHGKAVFPGFINSHIHCAQSIVRGVAEDLGRAPSYTNLVPQGDDLSDEESYIFSLLGAAGALRFGSTLISDNYAHSMANAKAFEEIGIRAIVSERVHDAKFSGLAHGRYEMDSQLGEVLLQKNMDLFEKYKDAESTITCCLGPHAPDTCSKELLLKISREAEKYQVPITTHLAQSKMELNKVLETYGYSSTQLLLNCGLLNERLLAAHCVFLEEEDMFLLGKNKVQIVHIPEGNAKAGVIAPIKKMQGLGLNVTIGTDNGAANMIENMRMALVSGRILDQSVTTPNPLDILKMVTSNGAEAFGKAEDLGSIEVGKKADLVVVNLDAYHMTPCTNVIGNLIHLGLGSDVETVIVDGKVVVKDGKVLAIDEKEVMKEARRIATLKWEKSNKNLDKKYMYMF